MLVHGDSRPDNLSLRQDLVYNYGQFWPHFSTLLAGIVLIVAIML